MIKAYKNYWNNIFNFSGTATRTEFFSAFIFNYFIAVFIAWIIGLTAGSLYGKIATMVYSVLFFLFWIGNITVIVRRLHDSDHSGWWFWIQFIPIIGQIWLFILMILPSAKNL